MPGESNSKRRRRKKSKDPRTDPQGQVGTTCPTTASVAENVKQMDADACGGDRLLSGHPNHLTTDRRSTLAEAPWDDRMPGDGSSGMPGVPDAPRERGLWAVEEASLPPSPGHCSDADTEPSSDECDDYPRFASSYGTLEDPSGYAVSTTSPADTNAVLLECLRTTAVNIYNGRTRSVIVFFDSGSNRSFISMKLAQELELPHLDRSYFCVNTFGTNIATPVEGFSTTVLLRSAEGYKVSIVVTASDRVVPTVTTALLKPGEVAMLQMKACSLISTRETPDLLIGQDLMHLFNRRCGPRLPNGFAVVWSALGPMAGGAGKVARTGTAADATAVAATSVPEPPSSVTIAPLTGPAEQRARKYSNGFNPEDPLNIWSLDDIAPWPSDNAAPEAEAPAPVHADNAGSGYGVSAVADASILLCALIEDEPAADLQRRRAHTSGFEKSQRSTTLGRTPPLRDLQLVTSNDLRKTQLRHPSPSNDRRHLGIIESRAMRYVNGCPGTSSSLPVAPRADPPADQSTHDAFTETEEPVDQAAPSAPQTELAWCHPADNAGGTNASFPDPTAYHPADNAGGTAVRVTSEHLATTTTTTYSSAQHLPLSRVTIVLPQSTQKQLSTNPLDTQPLLLPTLSTTVVKVEEVSEADNATELPKLVQGPLTSTKADVQCSSSKSLPPTQRDLIRTEIYEAGSPLKRKTRLRYCLPNYVRQLLGIYAVPESSKIYEANAPTAQIHDAILERTVNGPSTEPGIVKVGADNAPSETPPTSATIAEQNPCVPDTEAATDAKAADKPLATPDAATSSAADAPTIAVSAASQAVPAIIADIDDRIAPIAAGFTEPTDLLLKCQTATLGTSAPTRSPDTDPERDA
ncbi:hypothetical protein AAVH_39150 [Aphelenchoides avenae]|nr:hypothetical protein AAVH_39150 [Aphelenchus avenae]